MRISPRVPLHRFVLGVAVILGWSAAMVWVGGHMGPVAGALAGLLFTVPLCSLGEWLVHGVLYHNPLPGLGFIRDIHHKGHHFALFPPRHYVQESGFPFMRMRAPNRPWRMSDNAVDSALTEWAQIALHFAAGIPLILVPAWFGTSSVAFFVSSLATLSFISWMLAYVHGVIHTPGDRWIEHQAWFCWLDRHHYVHHVDITANMNFMMPICDTLFGTEQGTMTEAQAGRFPSFEEAKPMAKDIPARAGGTGHEAAEVIEATPKVVELPPGVLVLSGAPVPEDLGAAASAATTRREKRGRRPSGEMVGTA